MRLVRPQTVDDAILTSSDVALETQWSNVTAYTTGNVVRGTGDQAHNLYEALAGSTGVAVTDETKWLNLGPANRWAMFDGSPQSQTTKADVVDVVFDVVGRVNSVGLENINAETAQIIMTDAIDGVVYDETFSLVSDSGITDWLAYFTEAIEREPALYVLDLPTQYSDAQIEVIVTDTGSTVAIGELILGLSKYIGDTQWGGNVGIQDYSRKEVNDFGVASIVERAYAKRASFSVWVATGRIDTVADLLAQYRATPLLFVGDEDYTSTAVFGFLREWGIEISYPAVSVLNIEIEGLA